MATQSAMKKDIQNLEKVQAIDSEIYSCQQIALGIPEEIKALESEFEAEKRNLKSLEEGVKAAQLKQKQKEGELADKENGIKKLEGQLGSVKTNKEYSAIQTEIAGIKADNSILEEAIIKLFDEIEAAQKKLKEEQERVSVVEKEYGGKKAELEQKAAQASQKVKELQATKQSLIKDVNPEIARLYERIVEKKRGLALVKIDGEVCAACQMQLRPQIINEIKLGEAIVTCEQCSRILYSD